MDQDNWFKFSSTSSSLTVRRRTPQVETLELRRLLAFNPSGAEQELMHLTNRFRHDPAGEFSRLIERASPIKARDPVMQNDLDFFKVDGNLLRQELQALDPVPPLAWNDTLQLIAEDHNDEMCRVNRQYHQKSQDIYDRLRANDVIVTALGESIYGYGKSPLHIHAAYIIDWGQGGTGGMQADRPHRVLANNPNYDRVGSAILGCNKSDFGPLVNTQDFADVHQAPIMAVGSVFEDKNDSGWYENGEGIGNVKIEFSGPAGTFSTTTWSAGGYQIELPEGTYTATATGGGMKHPVVLSDVTVGSDNVWANFIYDPSAIPPDRLEVNNNRGDASLLTGRDQTLSRLSIHAGNDVDYFRFVAPEDGVASIDLSFKHAAGNLNLRLRSSSGSVIQTSSSNTNNEQIVAEVFSGRPYFVEVYSAGTAVNPNYSLSLDLPEPIAEDKYEPNDARASATQLPSGDQVLTNLSVHAKDDRDFFAFTSPSTGNGEVTVNFEHARGDLQLRLLDAEGQQLAVSEGSTSEERITYSFVRDEGYFIEVFSASNDVQPDYDLSLDVPEMAPPVARDDRAMMVWSENTIRIPILDNDRDPDGAHSALVPSWHGQAPAAFEMSDGRVQYQPPADYAGVHRARYVLRDDQGLVSSPAKVEVFVVNFSHDTPWQNKETPVDIDDDGFITPLDALLIINDLNARGSRVSPMTESGARGLFGFYDSNGDGYFTPIDALRVINHLNARGSGEGEGLAPSEDPAVQASPDFLQRWSAELQSRPVLWGTHSITLQADERQPLLPMISKQSMPEQLAQVASNSRQDSRLTSETPDEWLNRHEDPAWSTQSNRNLWCDAHSWAIAELFDAL